MPEQESFPSDGYESIAPGEIDPDREEARRGEDAAPNEQVEGKPSDLTWHKDRTSESGLGFRGVALWAVTALLSAVYLLAGLPKIGGMSLLIHRFEVWGYPEWFRMTVGGVEFIAAIFLMVPRTAFWASVVLAGIMLGAFYTHLMRGEALWSVVPLMCLAGLAFIAYERRPRNEKGDGAYYER